MRAVIYRSFGGTPIVDKVTDPTPSPQGVVVKVLASGLCRSDWHGWMGHDPDISLPHVPGHELVGEIVEVGAQVERFRAGMRVTVPFVSGCGHCPTCRGGDPQICDRQFQPGFTAWGSFAEYVALDYADHNVVRLPDEISTLSAVSLGCRFVTAFRGLIDRANLKADETLAVHGCGGVGLSAVMIGQAIGAKVVAVDIQHEALQLASTLGATSVIDAATTRVVPAIRDLTGGGADVSIDALGSNETCANSIDCLGKRGRHVQAGLLAGEDELPPVPMHKVIANELDLLGTHGMQAHRYDQLLQMMLGGELQPQRLITREINLSEAASEIGRMNKFANSGISVITNFEH